MAGVPLSSLPNSSAGPPSSAPKPTKEAWYNRDIQLFGGGLNEIFKENFYLEFASLSQAGLDIQSALRLLSEEQNKDKPKKTLEAIEQTLVKGSTLSEAFSSVPGFTPYEIHSLQIGEETGRLTTVLEQLAAYFKQRRQQRKQIMSALSYPLVIMLTAVLAVSFMLSFIVPMFSDLFGRFGSDLPAVTQMIIDFSAALSQYGLLAALGLFTLIAGFYLLRKKTWMRQASSWLLRKLPVVGPIVVGLNLARFCQALSLLVGAQVPLLRALSLLREMIPFYPIQHSLDSIGKGIMDGKPFHSCLAEHSIYEHRLVSLIKVGEEVNELERFFDRLSEQYAEQVSQRTAALNTFLEPLMILLLGGIIGFILISMYLPMFQLSTGFGG